MPRHNDFLFIWKKCIFFSYIKKTELILEWMVLSRSCFPKTRCLSQDSKSDNPPETPYEHDFSKDVPGISRAKVDMPVADIFIVNIYFSFDIACLHKIPVILLKCKDKNEQGISQPTKSQPWQLYLVGVREIMPKKGLMIHKHSLDNKQSAGLNSQLKSQFELIKLRKFSFNDQLCAINKNMFSVMPNYQILFINESLGTVVITYQRLSSKVTNNQEFKFGIEEKPKIDFNLLDVCHESKSGISYVLVGSTIRKVFLCFQISYGHNRECRLRSSEYDIKQISLNRFVSPDFIPITKHLQIISATSAVVNSTKSDVDSSMIYLLTETGYAIKIVNGAMKASVNVKSCLDAKQCAEGLWEIISYIHFIRLKDYDCDDMAVVQIDQFCCVINWSTQKVVQTWSPVLTISSHSDQHNGPESLLVVLQPKDSRREGKSPLHRLRESDILFVMQEEMNRAGHEGGQKNLNLPQLEKELTQLERPMKALRFQQKVSESSVRETEQLLHSKISFLTTSWKHLSQTSTDSGHNSFHECLVPLFSGSTKSCDLMKCSPKTRRLQPFGMWKRIFGHRLIIGLSVRNDCTRSVRDISLRLIPSLHGGTQSGHTMSRSTLEFHQTGLRDKSGALLPGQSTDICCHLDFSLSFTGDGVMLLAFICYQIVDSLEVLPEYIEEFYCEIIITAEDLFNRIYCIDKDIGSWKTELGISLSLVDLQALDAIQTCHTLTVQSIICSVGCLEHVLAEHSSFVYIDWAKQYIVVAGPQLWMCRVQLQEQISKRNINIKIFAGSPYETLLLVKLLNSLLPGDVTIVPGKVTETYLEKSGQELLEKTDSYMKCIRQTLTGESSNTVSDHHTMQQPTDGKSVPENSEAANQDTALTKFEDVPKVKKSKLS